MPASARLTPSRDKPKETAFIPRKIFKIKFRIKNLRGSSAHFPQASLADGLAKMSNRCSSPAQCPLATFEPAASLMAGALVVGTVVGPPLAQAATAGLIRLEGGGNSDVAKVASTGQLQVTQASPESLIAKFGQQNCKKGGIYKIPAGKALIITTVDFYNRAQPAGTIHSIFLTAGPSSAPCGHKAHPLAAQNTGDLALTDNQTFPTGIPVPE